MTTILKPKSLNIHSKSKIINLDEEEEKSCSPKKSPKKIKQNDPVFFQKKEKTQLNDLKLSYELTDPCSLVPCVPDIEKIILETFRKDDELTLGEKIAFSSWIVLNRNSLTEAMINNLNEEECHLSLLNWIWKYKKNLKNYCEFFQKSPNFKNLVKDNSNFQQYNKLIIEINLILELLINILNVFVFLPINSRDILHLKLYEKLFKIKEYIKFYTNDYLFNLIQFVLNKWKTIVDLDNEAKIVNRFKLNQLGLKRERQEEDKDTEADSEDGNEIKNKNNISNLSKNIKKTKKNIKVSFDLNKNTVIYFNKQDIPLKISNVKNKNE